MFKRFWIVAIIGMAGCSPRQREQVYEQDGFRFSPPSGWSERARAEESPSVPSKDRLLVQYKRLTAGHPAWLRVAVADSASSITPANYLANRSPGKGWKRTGAVETLELDGLPAARTLHRGHWQKKDYIAEIVAVRQAERVYLFTATYPAKDDQARDEARQAVAGATWHEAIALARR
jgi:hypothetical protein